MAPQSAPDVTSDEVLGLSLRAVERRWGPKVVLRGADLALTRGARGFLGGSNGAGKTTLLRIAAGLLEPDSGNVRLLGLDPQLDRRRYQQRLGYLPAGNGGLYARLSARRNLEFWARIALLPRGRRERAVDAAVRRFQLEEFEGGRVDRISMGQRQRVRLAITFLHEPDVVLLDEPHTSLDDSALALLGEALDDHHYRGGTSLWCAPRRAQADPDADAAFEVRDGVVVEA